MAGTDDTHRQIVVALRRIIRAVDQHSRKLSESFGLTGPQLLVLQELVTSGAVSTGELARRVHLAQGTTSEILDRLEEHGYVARTRSHIDKRKVDCTATPKGAELVARKPSLLQESFLRNLSHLADWERAMLLAALQRVAELMQEKETSPSVGINGDGDGDHRASVPEPQTEDADAFERR